MSDQEARSYELDEGMLDQLAAEFGHDKVAERYAEALGGGVAGAEEKAAEVFGDLGQAWMERSLELGERHPDRTYEIIRQAAEETGKYFFPHVPQRFVEIAYLGLLPISEVDVLQNNAKALVHRVEQCAVYGSVQKLCGEEVARTMACRHLCGVGLRTLYEKLRLAVDVEQKATTAAAGHCLFAATPRATTE